MRGGGLNRTLSPAWQNLALESVALESTAQACSQGYGSSFVERSCESVMWLVKMLWAEYQNIFTK